MKLAFILQFAARHSPWQKQRKESSFSFFCELERQDFFSCDCLMASMARSVECLNRKLDAVQVHLIGAVPIVQVKKWNEEQDHSYRSLTQTSKTKRARPATATRNPPARLPGARAKKQQQNTKRDFDHRSRYALTYIEVCRSMLESVNVQWLDPPCKWMFTTSQLRLQLATVKQRDELKQ